jgi:hypothetical protein
MLQNLYFKGVIKVDYLFINEGKKSTMKFANVMGNHNMKEIARYRNFKLTFFGEVFSI